MIGTFIGKTIIFVEKLFKKNASCFPGRVVLKLFPNYLKNISYPENIIMVTGSSGKGSTVSLIKETLTKSGQKVVANQDGSNLLDAIATTVIKNVKKNKVPADALVFEVDERYMKYVTKHIKPKYVVITNITRDQPPRQGSFEIVFNEIAKSLTDDIHLIVNGDDPILRKYSLIHKGKITYYGIAKTKYSYEKIDDVKDYEYCPKCHNKLEYTYYHYGCIGDYKCPKCDFKRDNISYEISNVDFNKDEITIQKHIISVNTNILFNLYNIITTYSVCDLLGVKKNIILSSLEESKINKKIFDYYEINNRKYTILNCKAENNATYNLSLIYAARDNERKVIVLGLREISRRYNHFDISWLYDINFEILKDKNVDKYICAGPYAFDFATRLKYAGINETDIITLTDLTYIKDIIENQTKGDIYGILNFDYVEPFVTKITEE